LRRSQKVPSYGGPFRLFDHEAAGFLIPYLYPEFKVVQLAFYKSSPSGPQLFRVSERLAYPDFIFQAAKVLSEDAYNFKMMLYSQV
jgi:hypothetical protein